MTLERQAFIATLGIQNDVSLPITELNVALDFRDAAGAPVIATSDPNNLTAVFFFREDDSVNVTGGVVGAGQVAGSTAAKANWIIIPSAGAGGSTLAGKVYSVGASISYKQGGTVRNVVVVPDTITVAPQPKLTLDYFLPIDVHGDDPFTPIAETPELFTLGVRIKNIGAGPAKRTQIETAQPTITENIQGLAIAFSIESAYVQNFLTQPNLLMNFGDINPQTAKVGRWQMKTSLSGSFSAFRADFTHDDQLGGALTSLIGTVTPHPLVKDVLVNKPGRNTVLDFLALDGDTYRTYESESVDTEVLDRSSAAVLTTEPTGDLKLVLPNSILPGYARVLDPTNGLLQIDTVFRVGGSNLPPENAWKSKKRLGNATLFTHYINVYDASGSGTYIIKPLRTDQAKISGQVFRDLDNDGIRDPAERGIHGATLRLTGSTQAGATVDRTLRSNVNGLYSFADLGVGSYSISTPLQPGLINGIATAGSAGGTAVPGTISTIAIASNAIATGYDFAKIATSATPQGDLDVLFESTSPNIGVSQSLEATVRVTNNGPDDGIGSMQLTLPTGLTLTSATTANGTFDVNTRIWSFGTLITPNNASLQIVVRADVAGTRTLRAQLTPQGTDPILSNNVAFLAISASTLAGDLLFADGFEAKSIKNYHYIGAQRIESDSTNPQASAADLANGDATPPIEDGFESTERGFEDEPKSP